MNTRLQALCLSLIILVADQLSKWWVLESFIRDQGTPLSFFEWLNTSERLGFNSLEVTPFFNLVLVWNQGISFGLFSDFSNTAMMLSGLSLVITIVLVAWLWRTKDISLQFILAAVIGGAIGNVVDRVRFGAVADFLDFHVAGFHWPAFNLADSAITIGVLLLLVKSFVEEKKA